MAVSSGLSLSPDRLANRASWLPSLPLAVGLAVFICLANVNGLPLLADPDSHWHIAVGHWILQHGAVPSVDTYSFTLTGQPWIAKEWLSQVLMAGAYDIGGWAGVVVLAAAAFGATSAMLLRLLLRDLRPLPALMFTAAAFVMMASHFLARPFALAFPFMLWWVSGLIRAVEEKRAPEPILLLAMLIWANLHGGFTMGLLLGGAFGLEALVNGADGAERKRIFWSWLKFGVAALLVACITPYGVGSILITFQIFGLGDALALIDEWKSPDFQTQPLTELILLVGLYLVLARGVKLPIMRTLIVVGLVHMFLQHVRNAELLATIAPLAIAPVLARNWPAIRRDDSAKMLFGGMAAPASFRAIGLGLLVATVYATGLVRFAGIKPPEATMPTAAMDYAREAGLKGRVLNHYGYGGYLISQGVPTFIDGRGELFGGEFIKKYVDAVHLRGEDPEVLQKTLEKYRIDWTMLLKEQPANKLLATLPGWRMAYSDDKTTIFVRE
ncbi:MAG: hypothetical protein J0J01_05455 [Reyranella sp.]|uniref:hypothetical protein n=1 Tax=Reyranella sp. TaxID=1929291 RepID=UPI001AD56C0F|nr:hypothetical protein [Reyranella sp.]MBN9086333.1 hypothetical protein [Reyranella sp.]